MNSHIALTSRSGNPFFAQTDGRTESNYFKKPDNLCGFKTQYKICSIDFHQRLQTRGNCSVNHTNWKSLQ